VIVTAGPRPTSIRRVLRDGFSLIARFVRAHPVAFALAVGGATGFAGAIVGAAFVVGRVTDTLIIPVLDGGEAVGSRWVGAALAVAGVAAWKAAAIALRRTAAGWLQFRSQADVRRRLIEHQLGLELAWFNRQATGDLLAVSETDARQSTWILAPLPFGTGSMLLLIGTVGIIAWIDPWLGLVALLALGLVTVVDVIGAWMTFEAFENVQRSRGRVSAVAHESFDGALTVKALGREGYETDRMEAASEQLRDDIVRVNRIWARFRMIVEAFPSATSVVMLVIGAARIRAGAISPGELVTIAYLLSLLSIPIRMIGFVLWDLAHSLAGWRRVQKVLDVDEHVTHGRLQAEPPGAGAAIEGQAVSFSYDGDVPVLAGVHIDIPAGRTVAVVGPTGSGKSTLAMLLARLWDPGTGRIRLDGRDLREFARSALPREVAFVSQEAFLFDDDVTGNVTLGLPIPESAVREAARLAAADEFVSALPDGYRTRIGERGTTLSGGQRQRIALARALVRRPRLLILDDATSAVDPSVETEILRGLQRAELPSTVVIVAHRRSSIVLADEVVFIDEGRVAGHGRHEDLLRSVPGYARLLQAYEEDAAERTSRGGGPGR
jgi:ABC-type multidrug transport system fused ATPase/permease subunit